MMTDEHPVPNTPTELTAGRHIRRHGIGEDTRALAAVHDRMEQLRRAEDASRVAGHAFRRAMREVAECQQSLAAAVAHLERVPATKSTLTQGSV
jgi:hypothetical protein